jgi:hypothetical protein
MSTNKRKLSRKGKGIQRLSAGWASWRWLSGISSKEKQWFLGSLQGRGGFEAWMAHMVNGLQDADFLMRFEATSDPWQRSKLVGTKISNLCKTFKAMSADQRAELAKQAESEMKVGLQLLGKDKKTIQELIALVDPPNVK